MFEITNRLQRRIFTIKSAEESLPLIYRLTEETAKKVKYLMGCIEALSNKKSNRSIELEAEVNILIEKWQNKMERLGVKPKGLWMADFDNGNGYYCWRFPETQILYKHGYQDGFSGRMLVSDKEDNRNADSPSTN